MLGPLPRAVFAAEGRGRIDQAKASAQAAQLRSLESHLTVQQGVSRRSGLSLDDVRQLNLSHPISDSGGGGGGGDGGGHDDFNAGDERKITSGQKLAPLPQSLSAYHDDTADANTAGRDDTAAAATACEDEEWHMQAPKIEPGTIVVGERQRNQRVGGGSRAGESHTRSTSTPFVPVPPSPMEPPGARLSAAGRRKGAHEIAHLRCSADALSDAVSLAGTSRVVQSGDVEVHISRAFMVRR